MTSTHEKEQRNRVLRIFELIGKLGRLIDSKEGKECPKNNAA
jgi:hypothetical protein